MRSFEDQKSGDGEQQEQHHPHVFDTVRQSVIAGPSGLNTVGPKACPPLEDEVNAIAVRNFTAATPSRHTTSFRRCGKCSQRLNPTPEQQSATVDQRAQNGCE